LQGSPEKASLWEFATRNLTSFDQGALGGDQPQRATDAEEEYFLHWDTSLALQTDLATAPPHNATADDVTLAPDFDNRAMLRGLSGLDHHAV
jgi:hypothetical protein